MSGFATKDESAVDIENSIFNVDGSGDAMYFTTSIFYTGCRFGLDNVQLNGTNALNMVGYHFYAGSLFLIRRSSFTTYLPTGYTMYVQFNGGLLDHDGTNVHSIGDIYIYATPAMTNGLFVLNASSVDVVTLTFVAIANSQVALLNSTLASSSVFTFTTATNFEFAIANSTLSATTTFTLTTATNMTFTVDNSSLDAFTYTHSTSKWNELY